MHVKLTPASTSPIENMKIFVNSFIALHMSIAWILKCRHRSFDMLTISECDIYRVGDNLVEPLNRIIYVTLNTKVQKKSPSWSPILERDWQVGMRTKLK